MHVATKHRARSVGGAVLMAAALLVAMVAMASPAHATTERGGGPDTAAATCNDRDLQLVSSTSGISAHASVSCTALVNSLAVDVNVFRDGVLVHDGSPAICRLTKACSTATPGLADPAGVQEWKAVATFSKNGIQEATLVDVLDH